MTPTEQALAEALWRNVDEDFAEDNPHQAFLAHCQQCGDLAFAAQRYRTRLIDAEKRRPEEAQQIEQRLKSIAGLAMADLGARKPQPPELGGVRLLVTIVGVLFVITAFGVLIAVMQM